MYKVDEDKAEAVFSQDLAFFKELETQFNRWDSNPAEPRDPMHFDLSYHTGEVKEDENEEGT